MKDEKDRTWLRRTVAGVLIASGVWQLVYYVNPKDLVAWMLSNWQTPALAALLIVLGIWIAFPKRKQKEIARRQESKKQGLVPDKQTDPAANAAKSRAEQVVGWAKSLKADLKHGKSFPWFNWA